LTFNSQLFLLCCPRKSFAISRRSCFLSTPILSLLLLSAMSAMSLFHSPSAGFVRAGPDPQETPSPFSTSSTYTPLSTSTSTSTSTSASVYEFDAEMGIVPSATMLFAPAQAPVQYPSMPFVPAHARIAEFEMLREELKRTEMVRERQVEMLHALAGEVSCGLDAPQVRLVSLPPLLHCRLYARLKLLILSYSSITVQRFPPPPSLFRNSFTTRSPSQSRPWVSQPTIHSISRLTTSISIKAYTLRLSPMSTSMPMPIPISHHGHRQQRHRLPYPLVYGAGSPDFIARGRVPKACESCKFRKVKCSGLFPCERCAGRAVRCTYEERRVRGPAKKRREKRDVAVKQVSSPSPAVSFFLFSCRGFMLIVSRVGYSLSVFSGHHNSMLHQPVSRPISPLPRLPPRSPDPGHFHSPHFPPPILPGRRPSQPSPLYPALSSHHPLPQYLP
jgi:hypothetical protein